MIPVALKISGFLSYKDPVELDFTSFDLACISGANGAGKSSLLDAITWTLFGQARRRDDTVINSYANAAEVRLDFLYEDQLYRIQRTKPRDKTTLLEFMVKDEDSDAWRPLTEHTVRDTELRIQSTLRLDYETFTNASFFLQGKADQFAQQRPSDRKRILGSILGLDAWETYRQAASDRRRAVESDALVYTSQLNEIEQELKQEDERRARLAQLEASLKESERQRQAQEKNLESLRRISAALEEQRRLLNTLREGYESARQRAERTAAQLAERQLEQSSAARQIANAAQVEAAYQNWQSVRQELQRWEEIAANFRQHESERAAPLMKIESQRSRMEQELTTLQSQANLIQEANAQIEPMKRRIQETDANIQALNQRLEERNALESQLAELQEERAHRNAENIALKAEMNQLVERIQRLGSAKSQEGQAEETCPLCGQPLSEADRLRLISELEAQGKQMGDRHRANQAWLAQCDGQRSQVQSQLNSLRQCETDLRQHQRQMDALHDRLNQVLAAIDTWERGGALRQQELESQLAEGHYALNARADLARVDNLLKDLGYDAAQHDAVRSAELAGRSSEEALRHLEAARASLAPLDREISELQNRLAAERGELEKQQTAFQEAENQFNSAAREIPNLQQAENDLYMLQEQENRLRMQVGGALQAVEVYKTLRIRQTTLQEERKSLQAQIGQLKSLEQAFGKDGVPALLIEQALPEIEAQANEILDRLTNGNMSVRFATQRDYKDKNREDKKETLDILISDAVGTREYELFSGGEAFRVNFAIRLALSRVLSQRAGARLQTLVIDEGFGSQDGEGRQRLVEAINLVRDDFAKVLVITHLEELKEAFPARIEVEKTPGGSRVRVAV